MPSAAGKRVGRVLAGCSKPEVGDKPCSHTWQVILGTRSLHRSARCRHRIVSCNRHVSRSDISIDTNFLRRDTRMTRTRVPSQELMFYLILAQSSQIMLSNQSIQETVIPGVPGIIPYYEILRNTNSGSRGDANLTTT